MTDEKFVCINCMQPASSLFHKYSKDVIRISQCTNCGNAVDKYVEYDSMLVIVDLIIHYSSAYRHLIYNTHIQKFPRLFLIFLFCDAYDKYIFERGLHMESTQIYDLEFIFYKSLLHSIIEMAAFITTMLMPVFIFHGNQHDWLFVFRATVLGYYGKIAVVLSIIFRLSNEMYYWLSIYLFIFVSHVQIRKALYHKTSLFVHIATVLAATFVSNVAVQCCSSLFSFF